MITGGELIIHDDEEWGYEWTECDYGEDMEMCLYPIPDPLGNPDYTYCDTTCAPNSGVRIDGVCEHYNIEITLYDTM